MSSDTIALFTYISTLIGYSIAIYVFRKKIKQIEKTQQLVVRFLKERKCAEVKIFVLDDSRDDLDLIEDMVLKKQSNQYETFDDESYFLKRLPSTRNVYIIDHFLIKTHGIYILQKLKEKNRGNFVISFSGTQNDQVYSDYVKEGVDRYIYKNNKDAYPNLAEAIREGISEACAWEN